MCRFVQFKIKQKIRGGQVASALPVPGCVLQYSDVAGYLLKFDRVWVFLTIFAGLLNMYLNYIEHYCLGVGLFWGYFMLFVLPSVL